MACLPSFHVLLTSNSSSAFNRRNRPPARPREQGNAIRLGPVVANGSSLQNIDHEIAGIIGGHQAGPLINSSSTIKGQAAEGRAKKKVSEEAFLPPVLEHGILIQSDLRVESRLNSS